MQFLIQTQGGESGAKDRQEPREAGREGAPGAAAAPHPPTRTPAPAPGAAPSHAEPWLAGLLSSTLGGRPDLVVVSSAARWTKVRAWREAAQALLSDLRLGSL